MVRSGKCIQGELLGIMSLHLILLAVNAIRPRLHRLVIMHSDCLGALSRVENLAPGKVSVACNHADVLKNILITCRWLTFQIIYEHVEAHQDDGQDFQSSSRAAQLNCAVDASAKWVLLVAVIGEESHPQCPFPLEPVVSFVGGQKLTPNTKKYTQYWIHQMLAREALLSMKILTMGQFDEVD